MASPAFRAVAQGPSGTDSDIVVKPVGTVDDDVMLAIIYTEPANAVTTLSGWTILAARFDTSTYGVSTFWKRAASEGISYTWSSPGGSFTIGVIISYSGCVTTVSPIDVMGTWQGATSSTMTGLAVTTATADTTIVQMGVVGDIGITQSTPPTSMTNRLNFGTIINDVAQAAAGSSGNKAATMSGSVDWASVLVALASVAPSGHPTSKRHGGVPFMALPGRRNVWAPCLSPCMLIGPSAPLRRAA